MKLFLSQQPHPRLRMPPHPRTAMTAPDPTNLSAVTGTAREKGNADDGTAAAEMPMEMKK